jgi:hypothetical protein
MTSDQIASKSRVGPGIGVARVRAGALLVFLVIAPAGCSVTPAERQAMADAWAARDRERAAECRRHGLGYAAGGCVGPGGP